jgi:hypothetical protein
MFALKKIGYVEGDRYHLLFLFKLLVKNLGSKDGLELEEKKKVCA